MPAAITWVLAAFLGLWPLVFVVAIAMHAFARRWRRVGQLAFLLPLWTVAASIGLMQLAPFVKALEGTGPSVRPMIAMALALCCAAVAWALLVRSFNRS